LVSPKEPISFRKVVMYDFFRGNEGILWQLADLFLDLKDQLWIPNPTCTCTRPNNPITQPSFSDEPEGNKKGKEGGGKIK
jgi:hypothetical protein